LVHHSQKELIELCLRLSKFKKENKELLTYLLFEESNENDFILGVKDEIEFQFTQINTSSYYFMKKSIRKILRMTKKFIRYSKKKETEIALLIHFCVELKNIRPSMTKNVSLQNIFDRQIVLIEKALLTLHEDLQFDYKMELEEILDN
jgi:vacuolar-type H+-ATPase catalytic subunit A/Vma1